MSPPTDPSLAQPGANRASAGELAVVAGLCALALVLRLRGIGFVLPCLPLSDSFPITQQVDWLRGKSWTEGFQPDLIPYPQLLGRVTALLPEPPDSPAPGAAIAEHLRLASEPWRQIRITAALISVLIVPGTWLLARRFLSRGTALLAAALVATSLMHVTFAVHEKPHGPLSGVIAFAALGAIALRRRADVPSYLLAGLATGLAAATLHSGVFALLMLPVAVLLREKREGRASILWSLATLAIVLCWLRFSYPALFQAHQDQVRVFQDGDQGVLEIPGGNEIYLPLLGGGGFAVVIAGLWSNDPILFLGVGLGLFSFAWSVASGKSGLERPRRLDLAVVLAFVLPYFAVLGAFDNTQERYVPPLLPFVGCLAAYGFERAFAFLRARVPALTARASAPVLATAMLAIALVPAWWLGEVRSRPDTYALVADHLSRTPGAEEGTILIPSAIDLPLLHSEAELARNAEYPQRSNWVRYQMRTPVELRSGPRYPILIAPGRAPEVAVALREDPLAYFVRHGARRVVLPPYPHFDPALRALRESGTLEARFVPEALDEGQATLFSYQHGHNEHPWSEPFFATVLSMRCMGQALEVYRLP